MEQCQFKIKVTPMLAETAIQNWTRVNWCGEYGYMAEFKKNMCMFLDLYGYLTFIDASSKSKKRLHKIVRKWIEKLYSIGAICILDTTIEAPFGIEFENKLPFKIDENIMEL